MAFLIWIEEKKNGLKAVSLKNIVKDLAEGVMAADAKYPQAVNVRSKKPYQPGIGPHTETRTIALVADELRDREDVTYYCNQLDLEIPYTNAKHSKCDLCIGPTRD